VDLFVDGGKKLKAAYHKDGSTPGKWDVYEQRISTAQATAGGEIKLVIRAENGNSIEAKARLPVTGDDVEVIWP
jgi:hypothetical protein